MKKLSDYEKKARDFLELSGTELSISLVGHDKFFDDDTQARDIYKVSILKKSPSTKLEELGAIRFGQSIAESGSCLNDNKKRKKPSAYDVLACITKYDPGSFSDFCAEYGYSEDSRKAEKVYFAVQEEWRLVLKTWGQFLDKLREIV